MFHQADLCMLKNFALRQYCYQKEGLGTVPAAGLEPAVPFPETMAVSLKPVAPPSTITNSICARASRAEKHSSKLNLFVRLSVYSRFSLVAAGPIQSLKITAL